MSGYSLKPRSFGGRVKVELDLPNYAAKVDLNLVSAIFYQFFFHQMIALKKL